MQANIGLLSEIERKAKALNQENANLQSKYEGDAKFMRIHKRLMESKRLVNPSAVKLHAALSAIKRDVDTAVLDSNQVLGNAAFFEKQTMPIVISKFRESPPAPDAETFKLINTLLVKEYLDQAQGRFTF
jgi:type I restriction enzyme R subunit